MRRVRLVRLQQTEPSSASKAMKILTRKEVLAKIVKDLLALYDLTPEDPKQPESKEKEPCLTITASGPPGCGKSRYLYSHLAEQMAALGATSYLFSESNGSETMKFYKQ